MTRASTSTKSSCRVLKKWRIFEREISPARGLFARRAGPGDQGPRAGLRQFEVSKQRQLDRSLYALVSARAQNLQNWR